MNSDAQNFLGDIATEGNSPVLLILGAGPKAVAVAAKAAVMRQLGLAAPRVRVIESHEVGANWQTVGGWTDGQHRLGTGPEKDIGFPYRSSVSRRHNSEINRRMQQFSWVAFLVAHGTFAEWVDRGKPNPHHSVWARYLQWVAGQIELEIIAGTVVAISADSGRWTLAVQPSKGGEVEVHGDALMITGPGTSREAILDDDRVLSVAQFWDKVARREIPATSQAAVIGGGETAGSVLDELVRHAALSISVISPGATIYTRGESYFENAMYSDPTRWLSLNASERREVIRRTDRGVFSVRVQENLLGDNRIHHLRGRVINAAREGESIALTLINQESAPQQSNFDLVVDATGGRPLWFLDLFTPEAMDLVELALKQSPTQENIETSINYNLAVSGLTPRLYLPNLAGFAQGPGFPNLSCLGELSNRVLSTPISLAARQIVGGGTSQVRRRDGVGSAP